MRIVAVTLPTSNESLAAVALATLKDSLRIAHADEDAMLTGLLLAAFDFADRGGRGFALRQAVYDYQINGFPVGTIRLPVWPIISIGQITYLDQTGTSQTLANNQYRLIGSAYPGLVEPARNTAWPAAMAGAATVSIRATIGHATVESMPRDFRNAIVALAAHWYRTPEAVGRNDQAEVPMGCRAIFERYGADCIA